VIEFKNALCCGHRKALMCLVSYHGNSKKPDYNCPRKEEHEDWQ
jgi:hypothetical protein